MARPDGGPAHNMGVRKKMVQPVLPALPLAPNAKKKTAPKEQENVVLNGSQAHSAVGLEAVQTEITPVVEADNITSSNDIKSTMSKDADVLTEAGGGSLSHEADSNATLPNLPSPEQVSDVTHVGTQIQEENTGIDIERKYDESRSTAVINDLNLSKHNSAITASIPVGNGNMVTSPTQLQNKHADSDVKDDVSTIPEAATGRAETQPLPHHSANPSTSGSVNQRTPQQPFTFPISPSSIISPQAHGLTSHGHQSTQSTSINGYGSPLGRIDAIDNGVAPFNNQHTFRSINDHLLSLLYSPEWYDCDICVYFPNADKPTFVRGAYSFMLIRSDRMRSFIEPQRAVSIPPYLINIGLGRPIDPNAFDAALRFFYTDTILSTDRLVPMHGSLDKAGRIRALDYVMSYMISGLELDAPPVVIRSLDAVDRLLDWDIAELVIGEAMRLRANSAAGSNPQAPPQMAMVARSMIQYVFNIIVLRLNVKSFRIDLITNPIDMRPRLLDGGRGKNPALANMVFGSMPSQNTSPISDPADISPDAVASVIMLNLDFDDLRELCQGLHRIHGEDGTRIINEVVEEREHRRTQIPHRRSMSNAQRQTRATTADFIGRREYVLNGTLFRDPPTAHA